MRVQLRGSVLYSRDELCKPSRFEAQQKEEEASIFWEGKKKKIYHLSGFLVSKFSDLHNSVDMHTGLWDLKLNTAMERPRLFSSPTA